MSPASSPPLHVPTLTEVVAWPDKAAVLEPTASSLHGPSAFDATPRLEVLAEALSPPPAVCPPMVDEVQLTQRVLTDVQRQIDSLVEFRLREAMAPILAAHSDALVRDLRAELTRTLGDVLSRSVSQELAKLRQLG